MFQPSSFGQDEVLDVSHCSGFASAVDGGLLSLALIAAYYRISCDASQMAHDLGLGQRAASIEDLVRAARRIGLKARATRGQTVSRLRSVPLPVILRLADGRFTILTHRLDGGKIRLVDPVTRTQSFDLFQNLAQAWSGEFVLVTRCLGGVGVDPATFDFSWFLPSIWRYRRPLVHILAASLFIQLFALVTPLFFQVVIDKVLVHKGGSTFS